MSRFAHIPAEPQDPIYGLQLAIKQDLRKDKHNLSIGILINNDGSLKKFTAVKKAEEALLATETKEYIPIDGLSEFRQAASELLLPKHTNSYTAQTVGGTGALFLVGRFLEKFITREILIPDPTWVNHRKLFEACGLKVKTYAHKAKKNGHLDLHHLVDAIQNAPEGSAILLQASCHNPTGIDPTMDDWQHLSLQILEKKLLPVFDLAYQGLGNGLAEDVLPIELFLRDGHEFFIANSFAKNFGIYSERTGSLTIVSKTATDPLASQIKKLIRSTYSSPPAHGARIVAKILSTTDLRAEWESELQHARLENNNKRKLLYEALQHAGAHSHAALIEKSIGLFSRFDISKEKVDQLREEGVYLADDGRINIAAVTENNAVRIATLLAK